MFSPFLQSSNSNNYNTNPPSMVMGFTRRPLPNYNQNKISIPMYTPSDSDKMTWGFPTWLLLHTLAEKVKLDDFSHIKTNLMSIIYMIVTNLPCPICSNHGKEYLDSINNATIQTKEDLKRMLFNFHNLVNTRKNYRIFTYDELNSKYSTAITFNVLQNFMSHYTKRSGSILLISDDIHRQRIVSNLKDFFSANINHFMP
jgi:hypothetical protein